MGTQSDMGRLLMRIESLEASRATKIKAAKAIRKLHKFMQVVYDEYALILEEWNEKHMSQFRK